MGAKVWPEVAKAQSENRHELVLYGNEIRERITKTGLDCTIFQLTSLNYLDIHETNITSIPEEISKLTNLQTLVLHSNQLTTIPDAIVKLGKLKLLDLSKNLLSSLPDNLDELLNLSSLNLSYNQFELGPKLVNCTKLAVLDLSRNKLKQFPELGAELSSLSEIKLGENSIEEIPGEISKLQSLKVLEINKNALKSIPGELSDCTKLKTLELKDNPISDRRLLKLIEQCRTIKQILDYVKLHCKKTPEIKTNKSAASKNKTADESDDDGEKDEEKVFKYVIKVRRASDTFKVIVLDSVRKVREHFLGCIVNDIKFTPESFKKFIQIQNKLHDTVCNKRTSSTIATHDFSKLPPGDLTYTVLPPKELILRPLSRNNPISGADLFNRLQTEANNLRKEKKRSTYSGIHKYLSLIEGQPNYPCILNGKNEVISFPPITNSEISKIDLQTTTILIEVTSSLTQHLCKTTLDALLKEMVQLFGNELTVTQLRSTDVDGSLRAIYPSKCDLNFSPEDDINVLRY